MLFVIVTRFKAHKVKVQEIKRKTFSLNRKGNTLYTLTECHYQKKKKKTTTTTTTKETIKKSQVLSLGLWRRRILFLTRLGDRSVLGLRISFFSLGLCFLCLNYSFLGLGSIFGL